MSYEYDKGTSGTTGSDVKYYNLSTVSTGDLIEADDWTSLRSAITTERSRRSLSSTSITSVSEGDLVTASAFNSLISAATSFMSVPSTVSTSTLVYASNFNTLINNINSAGKTCICNCNYCTCQCNQCTCNCNYDCTCNCNYHFILNSEFIHEQLY